MDKTYVIEFTIVHADGRTTDKKCKMKNCMSELHAKIKLGEHLKVKEPDFESLEVHECFPDFTGGSINDIFKGFGSGGPFSGGDDGLDSLRDIFGMNK